MWSLREQSLFTWDQCFSFLSFLRRGPEKELDELLTRGRTAVKESLNCLSIGGSAINILSINHISIALISSEKPDSVARQLNLCSTVNLMKQFCNINGLLGVMIRTLVLDKCTTVRCATWRQFL